MIGIETGSTLSLNGAVLIAALPSSGERMMALALVGLAFLSALFLVVRLNKNGQGEPDHDGQRRDLEAIAQLEVAVADLSHTRSRLEERIEQRNEELHSAHASMSNMSHEAAIGSRDLIQLISILTRPGVDLSHDPGGFLREFRGRIEALGLATSIAMEHQDANAVELERLLRRQIEPFVSNPDQQLSIAGPGLSVGVQCAQMFSLMAWELASRFGRMPRSNQSLVRIDVAWSLEVGSECGEILEFEWCESVGDLDFESRDASEAVDCITTPEPLDDFSESLVNQTIPRLLQAKSRIEIAPATFIYRMRCPASVVANWHTPSQNPSLPGDQAIRDEQPSTSSANLRVRQATLRAI